jgi:hypothetical protein
MSNDLDKTIATLPAAQRTAILDAVVNATKDSLVHVEYSWNRARDESRGVTGFLVGVADTTTGTTSTVLVMRPLGGERLMAISCAQVLRIKKASRPGPTARTTSGATAS